MRDSALRTLHSAIDWLPDMDLNHDKQIQSLLCYRYTIGQAGACRSVNLSVAESSNQTGPAKECAHLSFLHFGLRPAGWTGSARWLSPLPPGEGEATRVSRKLVRPHCRRRVSLIRARNPTKTSDLHIANRRRMILPLLGERAGVRGGVTTNLSDSRTTHHACRAEAQPRRTSRS